jgi:hypothetical protein
LETVRSYLVDLEALAHAARETLDHLPYMPRAASSEGPGLEVRLNYGRLQTLVAATAVSAKEVLLACDQMLEEPHEPPDDDGEDGNGGDGPDEPSGSSGNGGPDLLGSGYLPQAQAQAQHGVVEVCLDDIDDGPGLIGSGAPGVPGVPRARQSRGGIMLDVAAGPPELVPLVAAGSAHVALHPPTSA